MFVKEAKSRTWIRFLSGILKVRFRDISRPTCQILFLSVFKLLFHLDFGSKENFPEPWLKIDKKSENLPYEIRIKSKFDTGLENAPKIKLSPIRIKSEAKPVICPISQAFQDKTVTLPYYEKLTKKISIGIFSNLEIMFRDHFCKGFHIHQTSRWYWSVFWIPRFGIVMKTRLSLLWTDLVWPGSRFSLNLHGGLRSRDPRTEPVR